MKVNIDEAIKKHLIVDELWKTYVFTKSQEDYDRWVKKCQEFWK